MEEVKKAPIGTYEVMLAAYRRIGYQYPAPGSEERPAPGTTYGEMFTKDGEMTIPEGLISVPTPGDPFLLQEDVRGNGRIRAMFEVNAPRLTFRLKMVLCPTSRRGSEHEFYGACISHVQTYVVDDIARVARGARLRIMFGQELLADTQYDLVSLTVDVEDGVSGIKTIRNPDTGESERFNFKAPPLAQFRTMQTMVHSGPEPVPFADRLAEELNVLKSIPDIGLSPSPVEGAIRSLLPVETSLDGGTYTVDKRKWRIIFDNETPESVTIRLAPKLTPLDKEGNSNG